VLPLCSSVVRVELPIHSFQVMRLFWIHFPNLPIIFIF
jgi:hypothetical protein